MAMASPIEQFEIHTLSSPLFSIAGQPIAFTSASLYMIVAVVLALFFVVFSMRREAVIPGRLQVFAEMIFNMIANTLAEAAGPKSRPYLPFIFTLFMFIFSCNLLGMFPHVLTVTAHIIVNFTLALIVILTVIGVGLSKHGFKFLSIFVPHGVPGPLVPFISTLEFVSFWIRPCSLSLRLFGNMLAGHILLKVFAGMAGAIATDGWVASVGVFPVVLDILIIGFEFFVAGLQAYIFTVLSSVYLRDALELH